IVSFDFEELDRSNAAAEAASNRSVLAAGPVRLRPPASQPQPAVPAHVDMHGRRLMVLFFDLSSMQPEEIDRAVKTAHEYIDDRLAPADLVAVASFSTSLHVDQDFTADRALLTASIDRFSSQSGQGFEEGATGEADGTPDTGAAFTPDDTEFNIFNTDRR